MKQAEVLQYLCHIVRSLDDVERLLVYFPNEPLPDNVNDADLYFCVYCGGEFPAIETEKTTVSNIVGSIVLNGKINIGIDFLDKIADQIMTLFSPTNPRREKGFTLNREKGLVERFYVTSVERTAPGFDEGRLKITMFINFDVFEERIS